ncbi:fibrocystin-like [Argopecten irradians]|uniref:fibrocystin-like n=1 Tax=Argopecten irradians TaxID=31199 RepID=UPI00371368AA
MDIEYNDITTILEEFDDVGKVMFGSTVYGGNPYDILWRFTFDTYFGNVDQIQINASFVGGYNPTATTSTIVDGHTIINPLNRGMLQTVHDKPQVTVTINDIPSRCTGDCSYEWLPSSTPAVTNVTRTSVSPNTTIDITGAGFSPLSENNNVTIGGVACVVTMANDSLIICDVSEVPSGEYSVTVEVNGKGHCKI